MREKSRRQEKENLNKARVQCLADLMHCWGAGDFCHGCIMVGQTFSGNSRNGLGKWECPVSHIGQCLTMCWKSRYPNEIGLCLLK